MSTVIPQITQKKMAERFLCHTVICPRCFIVREVITSEGDGRCKQCPNSLNVHYLSYGKLQQIKEINEMPFRILKAYIIVLIGDATERGLDKAAGFLRRKLHLMDGI